MNQKSLRQNKEDDLSFDKSLSITDFSEEMAIQSGTAPKRRLISDVSFYDGISRVKSHWKVLISGQVLSFFLALSGAMGSSLFYECNVSLPTTQAALVFLFMSFHILNLFKQKDTTQRTQDKNNTGISKRKIFSYGRERGGVKNQDDDIRVEDLALGKTVSLDSQKQSSSSPHTFLGCVQLNVPWWAYFIFSFITVEATYFTFLSYKYTTLMSAALLDNFNIFAAMIASRLILKRRYSWRHLTGVFICLLGVVFNIFSDVEEARDETSEGDIASQFEAKEYPHRLIGDLLAILGGVLFGVCDVGIELIVKNFGGVDEYLGCVGFFGFFISIVQAAIIERSAIAKFLSPDEISMEKFEEYDSPYDAPRTCTQNHALALLLAYTFAGYLFNYGMSRFLTVSETALLMISILTADLWSVLFTVFAQHIMPSHFFFIAFVIVIAGVVIYEMSPSPLGASEDLQIHKEIEIEDRPEDKFEMSNISLSWESQDFNEMKNKEIV